MKYIIVSAQIFIFYKKKRVNKIRKNSMRQKTRLLSFYMLYIHISYI